MSHLPSSRNYGRAPETLGSLRKIIKTDINASRGRSKSSIASCDEEGQATWVHDGRYPFQMSQLGVDNDEGVSICSRMTPLASLLLAHGR